MDTFNKNVIVLTDDELKQYKELKKIISILWRDRGKEYSFNLSYFRSYRKKELIFTLKIFKKINNNKFYRPKRIYKKYENMIKAIREFYISTEDINKNPKEIIKDESKKLNNQEIKAEIILNN